MSSVVAVVGAPGVETAAVIDVIPQVNVTGDINITVSRSGRCETRVHWVPSSRLNDTLPRHSLSPDPFAFKLSPDTASEPMSLNNINATGFGTAVAIGAQAIVAGAPHVVTWHDTSFNHTDHTSTGALAMLGYVLRPLGAWLTLARVSDCTSDGVVTCLPQVL